MLAYKLIINLGQAAQCFLGGSAEGTNVLTSTDTFLFNEGPQGVVLRHDELLFPSESMMKYFSLVLAGLAGSPRMVSCTLLSLSKLVYEFHGEW